MASTRILSSLRGEELIAAGQRRCRATRELADSSRRRLDAARVRCLDSQVRLAASRLLADEMMRATTATLESNVVFLPRQNASSVARGAIPVLLREICWELGDERVAVVAAAVLAALGGLCGADLDREVAAVRRWLEDRAR